MLRGILPVLVIVSLFGVLGCGTTLPKLSFKKGIAQSQSNQLAEIAEKYYRAKSATAMHNVVAEAKAINANSAVYHELAADIAYLEANRDDRFNHLLDAILCLDNDVTLVHLREFYLLSWTYEQYRIAEALFTVLAKDHPDHEVRALAAHYSAINLYKRDKVKESKSVRTTIGWPIPFSIIGTWDNEQGKGFDIAYPPETEINLSATYPSKTVDIGWIEKPVIGAQGEIDLYQTMHPSSWVVAYGVSDFESQNGGEYELRVSTGDDFKVWLNGELIFKDRQIEGWSFDSMVIPIELKKGTNRILIKSAQELGGWDLFARVTKKGGETIAKDELTCVVSNEKIEHKKTNKEPLSAFEIVKTKVKSLNKGFARQIYFAIRWASFMDLDVPRTQLSESMNKDFPNSVRGHYELIMSLWTNQERARSSDLLAKIAEETGEDFVAIMLKQARFWQQNDLDRKARDLILELKDRYPDNAAVLFSVASVYSSEGWEEDYCQLIAEINERWPGWPDAERKLAGCFKSMGYETDAINIHDKMFKEFPGDSGLIEMMRSRAVRKLDFKEAEKWLEKMAAMWPERISTWHSLADLARTENLLKKAEKLWKKAIDLCPTSPSAYYALASMAYYEEQDKEKAIALWKEGFLRDPDNGALAERLTFLSPEEAGPSAEDIPTETDIQTAVALRNTTKFDKAADTAYLMDHSVAELKSDGSSINYTTTILHSLSVAGRDEITNRSIGCRGYSRILMAYSVDPKGKRAEASSIRGKTIRFRQLDVGSTVVIQSRCEQAPDGLIGDYFSYSWTFQSFRTQFVNSEYVLWTPKNTILNEHVQGEGIKREETDKGDMLRISWKAQNVPVLKSEAHMPNTADVAWRLQLSTIPDWEMFIKWEEALLQDVFRETPEVVKLSKELFEGTKNKQEKILKIHEFLASKIRYQQDYESYIAGVKPHTAPVVIARGYGDCKDKSVLFITLARLADIEVHMALVRTRGYGKVIKSVPSQQFNHAIVYVPKQDGITEGRFYDSTSDALDIEVLRSDDPGTLALVLNEVKNTFEWIEIPFQNSKLNSTTEIINLSMNEDGSATGKIELEFRGRLSAIARKISRNKEQFGKVVQIVLDAILPGGLVDELAEFDLESLRKTVKFDFKVKNETFARKNEKTKELKFKIPFDAEPEKMFSLDKRQHDLLLGCPSENTWTIKIEIPKKSKITFTPQSFEVKTECIDFYRKIKKQKTKLLVEQKLIYKCDRIFAKDYEMYRSKIQKMRQTNEEEVVVKIR